MRPLKNRQIGRTGLRRAAAGPRDGDALRSGGSKVLLVLPAGWVKGWLRDHLWSRTIPSAGIETVEIGQAFDPSRPEDWHAIAHCLDDRFLWMPCDYVAHRPALKELLATAADHPGAAVRFSGVVEAGPDGSIFETPTVLLKRGQLDGDTGQFKVAAVNGQPGASVRPPATVRDAEAELVRRSGKVTDGIYSRFNRKLCGPAVSWLSRTRVTPNAVTFGGLAVAVLAGLCFAQGAWLWNVAGALLFFLSGLFDEIDGMLARLKFQESAFGCWFETIVDYTTYLLVFAGMTVGGYRRGGTVYLALGAALLFGSVLSFFAISVQRKLVAPPGRPNEYSQRYLAALERDAANPISRAARQLQFLLKKGVLVHYVLLFAVLDLLPALLSLGAFGANAAWMATLYFNKRLFLPTTCERCWPQHPGPEVER
jgi:phosphatidylglycerophosphate synthase